MKDKSFVGHVRVKLINVDYRIDPDSPTLREWAGFENGKEMVVELYKDGEMWAMAGVNRSGEFGEVKETDWFSLTKEEAEIIE
jgi:hypothetical protein